MTNERNFDDESRHEFGSRGDDSATLGIAAFLGGTVVGAAICGAAVMAMKLFKLAGDEPPIRVKGGSLYLDLGCGGGAWEPRGSGGKKWKLDSGPRGKEEYDVSIVTSSTACSHKAPTGKNVRIEYTAGAVVRWVEIKAPGKKTLVDASHELIVTNGGQRLMWDVAGYISKIKVDGYECNFTSPADLEHALLMDF